MSVTIYTAPTCTPITVLELKDHLRLIESDEDAYLGNLIKAATEMVQVETQRSLITQTIKQYRNAFPVGDILLERGKIQSITSITYVDGDETTQTLDSSTYELKTGKEPHRAALADGESWPTDLSDTGDAVCITSVAGYGSSPEDVPETLRLAIMTLAAHWYVQKTPLGANANALPYGFEYMVGPFRIYMPC